MNKYIFLSFNIHKLGGGQTYLNTKVKYLKNNGYTVYVFSKGAKFASVPYNNLKEYNMNCFYDLNFPPTLIKKTRIHRILKMIEKRVNPKDDRIIIESCDDVTAMWGELIAKQFGCKHFCFSLNELFDGKNKYYKKYLDFFKYKFEKSEMAFISENCINYLFGDLYSNLDTSKYVLYAYSNAVDDVNVKIVDRIKKFDFNISYIGRYNKIYVNHILNDMVKFCRKNYEKKIGLTLIGDSINYKKEIFKKFDSLSNVTIFFTGVLIPIPKKIFTKFDVIIAGAGCAIFSYLYSKYVIVPDPNNCLCNGLLGYDTLSTLFIEKGKKQTTFDLALENVLINKKYEYNKRVDIEFENVDFYYKKHFDFINHKNDNEYYDVNKLGSSNKNMTIYVKSLLLDYLFFLNPLLMKIKNMKG